MKQEKLPPKFSPFDAEWRGKDSMYPGIDSSAKIHPDCRISTDVIIGANCVIGYDGFNYARNNQTGKATLKKHLGTVVIYGDVEIHHNTNIDRGLYSDTVIKKGVKIDSLVHVGHDVVVGENTLVAAGTVIGGGVIIGKNNFLGINVSIIPLITIGDYNLIGMAAVVIKPIGAYGIYAGSPARLLRSNREWWHK